MQAIIDSGKYICITIPTIKRRDLSGYEKITIWFVIPVCASTTHSGYIASPLPRQWSGSSPSQIFIGLTGMRHIRPIIALPVYIDPYNVITEFYVIDLASLHNVILEWSWIYIMKTVPSSYH